LGARDIMRREQKEYLTSWEQGHNEEGAKGIPNQLGAGDIMRREQKEYLTSWEQGT